MTARRHIVQWATVGAVALVAFSSPAIGAATPRTVPPTVPPATPDTADTAPRPTDPSQVELVESWAVAPAGSLDPTQAGNRPELSYVTEPGEVINDAVTVFNYGNVELTFRVYATDAINNEAGAFDLLAADQTPVDAGSWVTVAQGAITLAPGKQATIPITIIVPADVKPGDHVGAIIASNEATGTNTQGVSVKLDRRTGTRMYIRVAGALSPELAITNVDTTYHHALNPFSGSATVSFRVENRGNVRLGGTATVSVGGPFGLGERSITTPNIPELLPGQRVTIVTELNDVPALMLDGTTVRIAPTGAADVGDIVTRTGTDRTFAPPVTLLMLLLALLFALMSMRAYRRHRAADLRGDEDHVDADDRELQTT